MTVLLREAIGDRLRHARTNQRRTLRDISRAAKVSLGYLSEVERGQKEASSELLASICEALELPLGELLHNVAADVSALDTVDVATMAEGEGPKARGEASERREPACGFPLRAWARPCARRSARRRWSRHRFSDSSHEVTFRTWDVREVASRSFRGCGSG
jgi:transcriptional regulator with XRE-family HTH domain